MDGHSIMLEKWNNVQNDFSHKNTIDYIANVCIKNVQNKNNTISAYDLRCELAQAAGSVKKTLNNNNNDS